MVGTTPEQVTAVMAQPSRSPLLVGTDPQRIAINEDAPAPVNRNYFSHLEDRPKRRYVQLVSRA